MQLIRKYWVGVLVIFALLTVPLFMFQHSNFVGTDDAAVSMVQNIDRDYKPWFSGIKLFSSPEISSTLFALQAAIGAGVIAYYIGYSRGKQSCKKD